MIRVAFPRRSSSGGVRRTSADVRGGGAAVDGQHDARDVARRAAGEEQARGRHVLHLTNTSDVRGKDMSEASADASFTSASTTRAPAAVNRRAVANQIGRASCRERV